MDYCSPIKDKKRKTDTYNMNQSLKHFVVEEKRPGKRENIYNSTYMKPKNSQT